jgi:hypothetical protein
MANRPWVGWTCGWALFTSTNLNRLSERIPRSLLRGLQCECSRSRLSFADETSNPLKSQMMVTTFYSDNWCLSRGEWSDIINKIN